MPHTLLLGPDTRSNNGSSNEGIDITDNYNCDSFGSILNIVTHIRDEFLEQNKPEISAKYLSNLLAVYNALTTGKLKLRLKLSDLDFFLFFLWCCVYSFRFEKSNTVTDTEKYRHKNRHSTET